ncbi:hypothetical protein MN116_006194 [Schistosoma mekongi]|uniref:Prenyltransferase alpha-alpha toroid domain-containing protein n=1 Tax=Schistosoma mekongi TaxID=38744 RepID=A0AAE1ZAG5_SCHME|nr:hypothetical protein MN116_006194 [Schistosoma mekongi]
MNKINKTDCCGLYGCCATEGSMRFKSSLACTKRETDDKDRFENCNLKNSDEENGEYRTFRNKTLPDHVTNETHFVYDQFTLEPHGVQATQQLYHQAASSKKSTDSQNNGGGFRGSSLIGCPSDPEKAKLNRSKYDGSHVTMVYSALASLLLLGDDLSRVDRQGTLVGLSAMQCSDEPGLFKAGDICAERDMRFVFSAVASCYILNGLEYINCENVADFIAKCLTYQGGFANLPDLEAHAGATYCAVASLSLINKLESVIPVGSKSRNLLIKWLLNLQKEGFHGRIGKPDDTCYTFWVCASLKVIET